MKGDSGFPAIAGLTLFITIVGTVVCFLNQPISKIVFTPQEPTVDAKHFNTALQGISSDGTAVFRSSMPIVLSFKQHGSSPNLRGGRHKSQGQFIRTTNLRLNIPEHDVIEGRHYCPLNRTLPKDYDLLFDPSTESFIICHWTERGVEGWLMKAGTQRVLFYRGLNLPVGYTKDRNSRLGAFLDAFGRSECEPLYTEVPPTLDSESGLPCLPMRDTAALFVRNAQVDVSEQRMKRYGKSVVVKTTGAVKPESFGASVFRFSMPEKFLDRIQA